MAVLLAVFHTRLVAVLVRAILAVVVAVLVTVRITVLVAVFVAVFVTLALVAPPLCSYRCWGLQTSLRGP